MLLSKANAALTQPRKPLASPSNVSISRLRGASLVPPPISRVPGTCTLKPDGLPVDGRTEFHVCICSSNGTGHMAHGHASSSAVIHVEDLAADSVSHVLFWSTAKDAPDDLTLEFTSEHGQGVAALTVSKTFRRHVDDAGHFGCVYSAEVVPLTPAEREQASEAGMVEYADLKRRLNESYATAIAACAALTLACNRPIEAAACLTGITVGYFNVIGLMARVDGIGKDPLAQELGSRLLSNNAIRLAGMVALIGTFYQTHAHDMQGSAENAQVVFWLLSGLAIHKLVLFIHGGVVQKE